MTMGATDRHQMKGPRHKQLHPVRRSRLERRATYAVKRKILRRLLAQFKKPGG